MASQRTGEKTLAEPMVIWFPDSYVYVLFGLERLKAFIFFT